MLRVILTVLFITFIVALYLGLHLLVHRALQRLLDLSPRGARWLFRAMLGLAAFSVAVVALRRSLPLPVLRQSAYVWLGVLASSVPVLLLLWYSVWLWPQRRRLLAIGGLSLLVLILGYSLWAGTSEPVLRRLRIPLHGLPAKLAGFSIVQLSDLHLEEPVSSGRLHRIVDRVNALRPDLVVITGDIIDSGLERDGAIAATLRRLSARHGVLAVTGNHDIYAGLDGLLAVLRESGIRVLRGDAVTVAEAIQVVGIDDDQFRTVTEDHQHPLDRPLRGLDPDKPTILLYHRPFHFDEAARLGVDLQLSGHTHAGQIFPGYFIVQLVYRYPCGLYREGTSWLHVTSGTGLWGPPMRFLSRNEIVHLTLVP